MDEKIKDKTKFLLHLSNYIPKNEVFHSIILIMKFLPLFIITHDWNLSYEKGISFWIRKLTLCEIFSSSKLYYFYVILIIILFIVLMLLYFFFNFYLIIEKKRNLCQIYSYLLFYIYNAFSHYLYSFIAEIIFNKKKDDISFILYIIILIICIIFIIGTMYFDIYISTVFLHLSLFIHNKTLLINPLNKIDISTAFLSLIQGFIQLEFHIKFNQIILMKHIIRIIFFLYYLNDLIHLNTYYYRYSLEFIKKFLLTLCFFSCIIEWCFYYDYDNKLIILQKDTGIIILKIIVEINLSFLFIKIYFHINNIRIIKKVSTFHSKNLKNFDYSMVNFFNILYFNDRKILLKKILLELNLNLQNLIHKPKCKDKKCFYCNKYSFCEFNFEMEIFLNKKHIFDAPNLQYDFPLLYQYLYHEISILYDSFQVSRRKTSVPKLFIVITFHMLFERNYVKCLYLIEKTNSIDTESRDSLYCYQIEFLIAQIYSFYKGKKHKTLNLLSSNNDNIGKILYAESLIKNSLNSIKEIMITFNNEYINFSSFSRMIVSFLKEYKTLNYKINSLFRSTKCNIPYSKEKFSLYFKYVYGEIPEKLITNFDKFFSLQNSSLIEIYMKDTYLLLFKVQFQIKDISLHIQYGSPELISKLRYTTNQFKVLEIKSLFAKTFYKSYKYTITDFLRNGKDIIHFENFCLLDKDKYVILFDVEGISLYTTLGMVLFLKLKPAKEQLFITEKKKNKKKYNKYNNNDYKNLYGSCLIFTNVTGRIVSLSRGFEDFFHLKFDVLKENRINVKELFKLEKLDKKGFLKKELMSIYDNIINIFNEKIGLIGEDPFSKSIIDIKNIKDNVYKTNIKFVTQIYYEKREMKRENYEKKIYYLFLIDISIRGNSQNYLTTSLIDSSINDSAISKSNESNNTFDNSNKTEDKFTHTSLNQKILFSNKLSYYILKKYFNTLIISKKETKKDEYKDIIENNNNNKKDLKDFFLNDGIFNMKENQGSNNYVDVNRYFIIKKDNFYLRYLASFLLFIFPIIFIIMIIHKLTSLADQENYFRGHINFEMVGLTLMDVLSKVIYMQFQGNFLQPKILENYFNNTFEFHSEKLIERIYDYNSFFIKFYQFYTSRVVRTDPYFFDLYKKEVLYKIPDQNGRKIETIEQMSSIHLNELLSPTIENGPISIYYNNSDYYYTLDMVNQSNINALDYYYAASGYVGFLVNFLASYKYYNNEITNYYGTYSLDKKISSQKGITTNIILFIGCFIIYSLICFFIFYFQTQKLFGRYFIVFTQLRFFNHYLYKKTVLIYEFIDNHQNNIKENEILSNLVFDNDFEQISIIKHIMSGKIENFQQIKLKSLSIKYKNPIHEINEQNDSNINNNNRKESLITSLIKGSAFRNSSISKNNTHYSVSISNKITTRISKIEPRKKNSENIIAKIKEDKKKVKNTITRNLNNPNTTRTNITTSTFTSSAASSINLMNNSSTNKEIHHTPIGMIGNRLLSKPILYLNLFLTLIIISLILIGISFIYYYYSLNLVDSFEIIMSTFRSLFAEIKFPNEMLLDFLMSILINEEFNTIYESTPYSEICGQLKSQYYDKINRHEMFLELSQCWPEFKPTVDTLILGLADKKMKNLINFQFDTEGDFFCENYVQFLLKNQANKKLNDIKLLDDITYESILNECQHIGNGLNKNGFQTVLVSMYTTLNTLYNEFKSKDNRTEEYNIQMINKENFVMMQLETYYIFSKMSVCYYLIMNIDMEIAHKSALKFEGLFLFLHLFLIVITCFIYLYNVIKYGSDISSIIFFNKCILHMILFK